VTKKFFQPLGCTREIDDMALEVEVTHDGCIFRRLALAVGNNCCTVSWFRATLVQPRAAKADTGSERHTGSDPEIRLRLQCDTLLINIFELLNQLPNSAHAPSAIALRPLCSADVRRPPVDPQTFPDQFTKTFSKAQNWTVGGGETEWLFALYSLAAGICHEVGSKRSSRGPI
jgi:hypothetical protein